jgi:hypothetical protein
MQNNEQKLRAIAAELINLNDLVAAEAVERSIIYGSLDQAVDFHSIVLKVKKRQLSEYGKVFKSYKI